jgi:hypothetical protein
MTVTELMKRKKAALLANTELVTIQTTQTHSSDDNPIEGCSISRPLEPVQRPQEETREDDMDEHEGDEKARLRKEIKAAQTSKERCVHLVS